MREISLILAGILIAATSSGVEVSVRIHGRPTRAVQGRAIALSTNPAIHPVEFAVSSDSPAIVALASGQWTVSLQAPGFFHVDQIAFIEAGVKSIGMDVWPSASLTGLVRMPKNKSFPDAIKVSFGPAEVGRAQDVPRYEAICGLVEGKFDCAVPAGILDLRLRARSYVSHYRWAVDLKPGSTKNIGALDLKAGASLVGRIGVGPNLKLTDLTRATVTLESARLDGVATADDRRRAKGSTLSVNPNHRGFFHFEGVAPGEYTVQAVHGSSITAPIQVIVIDGAEGTLNERLVLASPRILTIHVSPAAPPEGERWSASLWRKVLGRYELSRSFEIRNGDADLAALVPGTYSLTIGPTSNDIWTRRSVTISDRAEDLSFEILSSKLSGTVFLGDEPLVAELVFGGENGALRTKLSSNATGNFSGYVPDSVGETWDVTIRSTQPEVKRTIRGVKLKRDGSGSEKRARIVLPAATIRGEVVDEYDKPVSKSIVTFERIGSGDPERAQIRPEADGSFKVSGVAPGEYNVQAQASQSLSNGSSYFAESQLDRIRVSDETYSVADVKLVVRRGTRYGGRISSGGVPVIGARIFVIPTDDARLVNPSTTSDSEGRFSQELPPGTREIDVVIAPPGFAFRMFHTQLRPETVDLAADQRGGTLVIETQGLENSGIALAYLRHGGAVFPLLTIATAWARGNMLKLEGDRYRLTLPMMEPGQYSVCLATDAELPSIRGGLAPSQCTSGFLPVFGQLSLVGPAVKGE